MEWKLENEECKKNYSEQILRFYGIIGVIAFLILGIVSYVKIKSIIFLIMFIIPVLFIFILMIYLSYGIQTDFYNANRTKFKQYGERKNAYIIYANIASSRRFHFIPPPEHGSIRIRYDNNYEIIRGIKANKALRILILLLDKYPIDSKNSIPINIYVYNSKIYADLDNVDLSIVGGFEEAKKVVEELY